jgi:protein gp37
MARRLRLMGQKRYRNEFELTLQPDVVELPLHWWTPRLVFVNSMSDLFHHDVPADYIARVFDTMKRASWHTFQVLTKRADRLAELAPDLPWPDNIWMGVSIESQKFVRRIEHLATVPAHVRFLSVEPLLRPLTNLPLEGIHWVIVGGESGPGARPMNAEWVRSIRDKCIDERVPFFFKQWGGPVKALTGRVLDGRTWDEMPPLVTHKRTPLRKAASTRRVMLPLAASR